MRSCILLVGILGSTMLWGCGLLDSSDAPAEGDEAAVQPPAAKVALSKPIQRKPKPAAATPQAPAPKKQAVEDVADEDDEADEDDDAEEPTRSRRADRDDDDDDDDVAEPKKERDLGADLFVKRLVIAKGVKGREPVGASSKFTKEDKVYAFVEIGNRDQVPSEVYVSFYEKKSGKGQRVPLKIGAGSRWRTWVYTRNAKTPGTWLAVVKNAKGKTLASQSFEITGKKKKKAEKKPEKKKAEKKPEKKKAEKKPEKAEKKPEKKKAEKKKTSEAKPASKKADKPAKKADDKKADDKKKKKKK